MISGAALRIEKTNKQFQVSYFILDELNKSQEKLKQNWYWEEDGNEL